MGLESLHYNQNQIDLIYIPQGLHIDNNNDTLYVNLEELMTSIMLNAAQLMSYPSIWSY